MISIRDLKGSFNKGTILRAYKNHSVKKKVTIRESLFLVYQMSEQYQEFTELGVLLTEPETIRFCNIMNSYYNYKAFRYEKIPFLEFLNINSKKGVKHG